MITKKAKKSLIFQLNFKLGIFILPIFLFSFVFFVNKVSAIDGLMNGKTVTGQTDNYLFWLQTFDEGNYPFYFDQFFVNKSGSVGIGNAAPAYKLDVSGTGRFTQPVLIGTPTATGHAATKNYVDSTIGGGSGSTVGYWTMNGTNISNSNTGNVGIGTSDPTEKLEVSGGRIKSTFNTDSPGFLLYSAAADANNRNWGMFSNFNIYGDLDIRQSTALNGSPYSAGTSRLYIKNDGNVGIGTTAPGGKLTVLGTAGVDAFIQATTAAAGSTFNDGLMMGMFSDSIAYILNREAGDLRFGTNNAEAIRIDSAGNIGIGAIAPSYKLDVSGTGQFTQPVLVGTPTATGHATTKSYVDSTAVAAAGGGIPTAVNGYTLRASGTSWVANSLLYNNGTNVGIGTTNPASRLTVDAAKREHIYFTTSGETALNKIVGFFSPQDTKWEIGPTAKAVGIVGPRIDISGETYGANPDTISLITGDTDRMRITSEGNVGIGTTNPGAKLDIELSSVNGNYTNGLIISTNDIAYTGSGGALTLGSKTNGVLAKSVLANILTSGAAGYEDSDISISTTKSGVLTEKMRITSAGNVGIGTTTPAYKLDVSGTGRFTQPVLVGTPTAAGHATTKSYVDSTIGGGSGSTVGYWTMTGTNISNSNTGNVGIGTTAPETSLSIQNNTYRQLSLKGGSGHQTLNLGSVESSVGSYIYNNAYYQSSYNYIPSQTSASGIQMQNNGSIDLLANSGLTIGTAYRPTSRIKILADGNVGIGTTAPDTKLAVYATTGSRFISLNSGGSQQDAAFGLVNDRGVSRLDLTFNTEYGADVWSERMRLTNEGNVGIGNTAPSYKLDVSGTGRFTQPVLVGAPTADGHAATRSYVDSTVGGGSGSTVGYWTMSGTNISNSNTGNVGIGTTNPLSKFQVRAGADQNFRISAGTTLELASINDADSAYAPLVMRASKFDFENGNVGIGTTAPANALDVRTTGDYIFAAQGAGGKGLVFANDASHADIVGLTATHGGYNPINFRTSATDGQLYLNTNGNVGIGTTTPGYKLDVSGTGRFTQPVLVGTPTAAGHATTKSYVDSTAVAAAGGGIPAAVNGYTLRASGTSWIANSTLYNNGTNVGVGTTAPGSKLEIYGTGQLVANLTDAGARSDMLALNSANTAAGSGGALIFGNSQSKAAGSIGWASIKGHLINGGGNTAGDLTFSTRNATTDIYLTERMRILANGKIGIGTAGPSARLDINYQGVFNATTPGHSYYGLHFSGQTTSDYATGITWNGGSTTGTQAGLYVQGSGAYGTKMYLATTDSYAVGAKTRLMINQSGSVGIGTIAPAYALDVSGTGRFTQPVLVGAPTAAGHATTKSYVDSTAGGGVGSGSSGQTLRHNGTSWVANSLLYNNGTNVGIGTSNPGYKLQINGNEQLVIGSTGSGQSFVAGSKSNEPGGAAGYAAYWAYDAYFNDSTDTWMPVRDSLGGKWKTEANYHTGKYTIDYSAGYNPISWTNLFTIQSNGSVGIGNTAPSYKLDVSGTGRFTQPVLVGAPTADGHAATRSYVDSTVGGGSGSTVGYWTMSGTNISNSNTGNVGMGITNPSLKLSVVGNNSLTNLSTRNATGTVLILDNTIPSYVGGGGKIVFGSTYYTGASTMSTAVIGSYKEYAPDNGANEYKHSLVFSTADSASGIAERMRITSSGNVGIGTTNPTEKLAVEAANAKLRVRAVGNAGTSTIETMRLVIGTNTDGAFPNTAGNRLTFASRWTDATEFTTAAIESHHSSSWGGGLVFLTKPSDGNSAGEMLTRMVINQNGNVGIGTTTPGYKLDVSGTGRFTQPVLVGAPTAAGHATTKSYVDSAAGGGVGAGSSGQTLRHNGTSWVASSLLYNNGTNIGIGTTSPGTTLDVVSANANPLRIYRNSANSSLQVQNNATSAFFGLNVSNNIALGFSLDQTNAPFQITSGGNVGIGVTNPAMSLHIKGRTLYPGFGYPQLLLEDSGGEYPGLIFKGTGGDDGAIRIENGDGFGFYSYNGSSWANVLRIQEAGNVGIGTTAPDGKLDVAGAIVTDNGSKHYRSVVGINSTPASQTGTLKIKMPKSWSSTMMTVTIKGYNYSGIGSWELVVGGYNYGGGSWINTSAEIKGTAPFNQVRLAHDGTSNVILLGSTSTVWSYPKAEVTDMIAGFSNITGWGTGWEMSFINDETGIASVNSPTLHYYLNASGNLGLGTVSPAYTLDVSGTGRFTQPVLVGAPTAAGHATTKSYVDSAAGGGVGAGSSGQTLRHNGTSWVANSALYNNGTNIGIGTATPGAYKLNVAGSVYIGGALELSAGSNLVTSGTISANKINVGTIDPLYNLQGTNYASFAASVVGGVKEETTGRVMIDQAVADEYQKTIDFKRQTVGSDLWVWYNVIDFDKDNVEVLLTPYGKPANVYYSISGEKLTFHSDIPVEVSYRLIAKRFDWKDWPTKAKDQNEKPNFILK